MKLHDRVIRAGFFNRAQFVLSFTRDERLFYEGLMLLSDDSHCLLEDPWEFKLHLFPVDADITAGMLSAWTEKFVAAGKLIRYTAKGKKCLFLVNGPEHQRQGDMERPEVPLPVWVTWKPYPKNPYRGSYQFGDPLSLEAAAPVDAAAPLGEPISSIDKEEVDAGLGLSQPTLRTKPLDYDYDKIGIKRSPPPPFSGSGAAGADAPSVEVELPLPEPDGQQHGRSQRKRAAKQDPVLKALADACYDAAVSAGAKPADGGWWGAVYGRAKHLAPDARAELVSAVGWCASPSRPTYMAAWVARADLPQIVTAYRNRLRAVPARASPGGEDALWAELRARTDAQMRGGD